MKPQFFNGKMVRILNKNRFTGIFVLITTLLLVALMTGSMYMKNTVYITDGGVTKQLFTTESNPELILQYGEYKIGKNDRVDYSEFDSEVAYITIERAFGVDIYCDGIITTIHSIDKTTAQILDEAEITLGEFDEVNLPFDKIVARGEEIEVTRISYKDTVFTEVLPYETEYIYNSNKVIGDDTLLNGGADGEKSFIVRTKYVNGVAVSGETISETVTVAAVPKRIEKGTALAVPYALMDNPSDITLENGLPVEYTRIVSGKGTAYTSDNPNSLTASGRDIKIGTVAVNPNVIPYGSELYIVSQDGKTVYGYAIAADTGGGLMEGQIVVDVYVGDTANHLKDAYWWGAHQVDIYVLSEGDGSVVF